MTPPHIDLNQCSHEYQENIPNDHSAQQWDEIIDEKYLTLRRLQLEIHSLTIGLKETKNTKKACSNIQD